MCKVVGLHYLKTRVDYFINFAVSCESGSGPDGIRTNPDGPGRNPDAIRMAIRPWKKKHFGFNVESISRCRLHPDIWMVSVLRFQILRSSGGLGSAKLVLRPSFSATAWGGAPGQGYIDIFWGGVASYIDFFSCQNNHLVLSLPICCPQHSSGSP